MVRGRGTCSVTCLSLTPTCSRRSWVPPFKTGGTEIRLLGVGVGVSPPPWQNAAQGLPAAQTWALPREPVGLALARPGLRCVVCLERGLAASQGTCH